MVQRKRSRRVPVGRYVVEVARGADWVVAGSEASHAVAMGVADSMTFRWRVPQYRVRVRLEVVGDA
jgi:hypothetical protein